MANLYGPIIAYYNTCFFNIYRSKRGKTIAKFSVSFTIYFLYSYSHMMSLWYLISLDNECIEMTYSLKVEGEFMQIVRWDVWSVINLPTGDQSLAPPSPSPCPSSPLWGAPSHSSPGRPPPPPSPQCVVPTFPWRPSVGFPLKGNIVVSVVISKYWERKKSRIF